MFNDQFIKNQFGTTVGQVDAFGTVRDTAGFTLGRFDHRTNEFLEPGGFNTGLRVGADPLNQNRITGIGGVNTGLRLDRNRW